MAETLAYEAPDYKHLVRWPATPRCRSRTCGANPPMVPFRIGTWWWLDCPDCFAHLACELGERPAQFCEGIPF